MTIAYTQANILATDYINALDNESEFSIQCRYLLLTEAVTTYNKTCSHVNNLKPLKLEGKAGEPISLTH